MRPAFFQLNYSAIGNDELGVMNAEFVFIPHSAFIIHHFLLKAIVGIEPTTCCLQDSRSESHLS
jgi:hypothetical protein